MKTLQKIVLFALLISGTYKVIDNSGNETIFVFKKYNGYYVQPNKLGEYFYFDHWTKRDKITIVYKSHGLYEGTKTYRIVQDKLIEQYNDHTLIIKKQL